MYLAIDIGGTKTLIALFSKRGRVVQRRKFKTAKAEVKALFVIAAFGGGYLNAIVPLLGASRMRIVDWRDDFIEEALRVLVFEDKVWKRC